MMTRFLAFSAAALCAGLLAGCTPSDETRTDVAVSSGSTADCLNRSYPEIGGPISLTDHTGQAVTQEDYKGAYTLIYFGFTYCPDVCPMTLVNVQRAYEQLPKGVSPPQTLLISIDPERDTPEALAAYVEAPRFPDNLTGLTGTPGQIRAAADEFVADYSRVDQPGSAADYTMDHTSLLYLMDPDWQLKTFFTHEDTPETMAACLGKVLAG